MSGYFILCLYLNQYSAVIYVYDHVVRTKKVAWLFQSSGNSEGDGPINYFAGLLKNRDKNLSMREYHAVHENKCCAEFRLPAKAFSSSSTSLSSSTSTAPQGREALLSPLSVTARADRSISLGSTGNTMNRSLDWIPLWLAGSLSGPQYSKRCLHWPLKLARNLTPWICEKKTLQKDIRWTDQLLWQSYEQRTRKIIIT